MTRPDHFDPAWYPLGHNELNMIAHDWPELSPERPRVFLECGTCGAMFLTAFRVKFCRVCWQERHAHA